MEKQMATTDRHPADPAVDRFGPKPTDRFLPLGRRTHPGPYLIALILVLLIGLALVAFGGLRLIESTATIEARPEAAAPADNLLPSYQQPSSNEAFDRNVEPSSGKKVDGGGSVPDAQ
jgi:hypothetical protein